MPPTIEIPVKTHKDLKAAKARVGELSPENDRLRKQLGQAQDDAKRNADAAAELAKAKTKIAERDAELAACHEQRRAQSQQVLEVQSELGLLAAARAIIAAREAQK